MRFACSTASFPYDRLSIAIAKTAWAGYQEAELLLSGPELPPLEEIRARLAANELRVGSVRGGVLPGESGEAALPALTAIGETAALARSLGSSTLVVQAPKTGDAGGMARALRMLDGALGGMVLDVCLVNEPGSLLATPADAHALWTAGLPERVGLALDPGRALLAGWDAADLDSLPELPRHVYLNDARAGKLVPPGEGDVDQEELGAALAQIGYGQAVCLLLENADAWAVEPTARELRTSAELWFGRA